MSTTETTPADPMFKRIYMEVQAVLDKALGAEEEDRSMEGGLEADVLLLARQRDEARAELARVRSGAETLGKVVCWQARSMEAARIEMIQNGPEKAMQWILNSIPDVDDNDPEDQWNGTETATEWIERVQAADKAYEAARHGAGPCCTSCGDECGCGGSPHEAPEAAR